MIDYMKQCIHSRMHVATYVVRTYKVLHLSDFKFPRPPPATIITTTTYHLLHVCELWRIAAWCYKGIVERSPSSWRVCSRSDQKHELTPHALKNQSSNCISIDEIFKCSFENERNWKPSYKHRWNPCSCWNPQRSFPPPSQKLRGSMRTLQTATAAAGQKCPKIRWGAWYSSLL